ncbi:pyruvate phosphate dikinase PEP/pyruvate-binding protein [Stanieria sp. NIES-3757]|nr:pyruvate phosphate dikinase PEP/pyruvate-binding protein [Stanieria sp. NIES-3757]
MTLVQVWGSLAIFIICPLLGGLPLIDWLTYALTGRQLTKLGTGNVSVSAAFYHGGTLAGILAVLSEAAKGIVAILLARMFFPVNSVWEIIALIALVMGRYWLSKGAGTTNVVWGIVVHDAIAAGLIFFISGVSFTINRNRSTAKYSVLVLLTLIIALRHPEQPEYGIITLALSTLLAWIYQQIPDDLDLSVTKATSNSQTMFRFFRGNKNLKSLDVQLDATQVGQKAANLAFLKKLGYPVPDGWVLFPGDDPNQIVKYLEPSVQQPLVVRSSAIGEDTQSDSAAGQYLSILNITNQEMLKTAILDCQVSYLESTAREYRRSRQQHEQSLAVLIQKQIEGIYSGVAFSRDPVDSVNEGIAIEVLPGDATQVVSGKVTPYRYRVIMPDLSLSVIDKDRNHRSIKIIHENSTSSTEQTIPTEILESVALLAQEMEELFQGIPQDLEWTYDGEKIWLLQVRPITTLQPIWTRKIASEVIPGVIRPLTWSINQPLTCGVWGKLFTLVLGQKSVRGLDFNQTATLHFSQAYFNATLLGTIFRRMGLPPESLEFLTRGESFTKPPIQSTLKNLPGLWRLLQRELNLAKDFQRDRQKIFFPTLRELETTPAKNLSDHAILERIEKILAALDQATYYTILAPLSLALRQATFQIPETNLNHSQTPELESMRTLACLASDTRKLLAAEKITLNSCASLFVQIAENPEGESILTRFEQWLEKYGYLSEVATDIAVPRWRENPRPIREIFTQFFFDSEKRKQAESFRHTTSKSWLTKSVQQRLNLKNCSSEIYNKLLAHLRWSFLALEENWLKEGKLSNPETIFFLKFNEINSIIREPSVDDGQQLSKLIEQRQQKWQQERELKQIPYLVYGYPDYTVLNNFSLSAFERPRFKGIGGSGGEIEGYIKVLSSLNANIDVDKETILVVPYTDAGWSPVLARVGGLIAEVGGRLSHGAIIAREYNIPAVMDIPHATQLLQTGQRVKINGYTGIVEIIN